MTAKTKRGWTWLWCWRKHGGCWHVFKRGAHLSACGQREKPNRQPRGLSFRDATTGHRCWTCARVARGRT